jgi:hypothetical protein
LYTATPAGFCIPTFELVGFDAEAIKGERNTKLNKG